MKVPDFPHRVTVEATDNGGAASYERSGDTVSLQFDVTIPSILTPIIGHNFAEAVEKSCEAEVERTRVALERLVNDMLAKLPPSSDSADIARGHNKWSEQRRWRRSIDSITIAPSRHTIKSRTDLADPYSDAAVIRAVAANALADHAEAVRAVYQQIFADARSKGRTSLN